MGTALVAHEAGHQMRGDGVIEWHGTDWRCTDRCDAEGIAVAGFYSQATVSEAFARHYKGSEYRAYRNGIRTFNTIQPIFYALKNDKDLGNLTARHDRNARVLLFIFAGYSAFQLEF
jgi:hypothetical protein